MAESPPVVAILNTNDDTVEMLRIMIESEGMIGVSAHLDQIRRGQLDLAGFLDEHDPAVIIYDIAPPYDRSWNFYRHLRRTKSAAGRKFVLTSTNPARVKQIAGADEPVLEVVGKPYDMQQIVDAIKAAIA